MSDPREAIDEFITAMLNATAVAVEECAERILLSGTNRGIEVHTWVHDNQFTVIAEPSTATAGVWYHATIHEPPPPPGPDGVIRRSS